MCVAGLPKVVDPLWQVEQPLTIPVWFIAAPFLKLTVDLWQVSQAAVVCMCVAGLPNAVAPLWQLAQPLTIPVWFIVAPAKLVVDL